MKMIPLNFYQEEAVCLAPKLLGKLLCRKTEEGIIRVRITETEAYMPFDTACHASRGKTPRNAVMYNLGGVAYVYLCYGIHNMLNFVTGADGSPQAVLIRGTEGAIGPGIVTKRLGITRALNGAPLIGGELWLEDDGVQSEYTAAPRVGIDYASPEDRERLWRFTAQAKA